MRENRPRREWRVKEEEDQRRSRSSPEMGPVESWRFGRREKERYSEFSGSEDDTSVRPTVRKADFVRMENKERGGFEKVGRGNLKDGRGSFEKDGGGVFEKVGRGSLEKDGRGGLERAGERQQIGEDKDERERFHNILLLC